MHLYGTTWKDGTDPLLIEFACIRKGGQWVNAEGYVCGLGLFEHYQRAMRLMWPEDEDHRWSDLCTRRLAENDITVIMGSSDSSKTYTISKFIMTDWWVDPMRTLWMVSSTDKRGAELRIWGKLKEFFNRAKRRYSWLPGKVLESKSCITPSEISDDGSEGRLLTQGIIFIPCKQGNTWLGLGPWAGIKPPSGGRLGHAGDECFPAGTLVDTPKGPKAIETIREGDSVYCATGIGMVKHSMSRLSDKMANIRLKDGRTIPCTPNHRFFTNKGWKQACELNESHYMLSVYETMQIMRGSVPATIQPKDLSEMPGGTNEGDLQKLREWISEKSMGDENILFTEMHGDFSAERPGLSKEVLHEETIRQNRSDKDVQARGERASSEDVHQNDEELAQVDDSRAENGIPEVNKPEAQGDWPQAFCARRKWNPPHEGRAAVDEDVSSSSLELRGQNWKMERERNTSDLQTRSGLPGNKTRNRSGWRIPRRNLSEGEGQEERQLSNGAWVDCVEIYEQGDSGFQNPDCNHRGCRVFNLEVEPHHSYSVNGLVAANCQLMQQGFLDAYANWYGKENFKGILTGNPGDLEDPLCVAGEPEDGWENWKDTGKTQEWKSKFYGAHVIALDGRDSPNNDFPYVGGKPRYKFLIGKKKIDSVKSLYGDNDWHWWNQCVGKPQTSVQARRIITRALVEKGQAYDEPIWVDNNRTKVASLDAAYGGVGGDRCVFMDGEFGKDVNGKVIIAPGPWVNVPISVDLGSEPAENQIVMFCKSMCESKGIPPTNFFFDGRGTLALAFARLWSPDVNVVDFGGKPTDRPVSQDEYVWDGDSARRLKLCSEHYFNFVSELWFSMHYLIVSGQLKNMDREVARESFKRTWDMTKGNKIQIETKRDMKERTLNSPDLVDSTVTLIEGARRLGLQIGSSASPLVVSGVDYLERELAKYRKIAKASSLRYDTAH